MAAPIGPEKVHRYMVEFKIQAVRLSLHPDIQTRDVANALDIHTFMLSKWKKDYGEGKLKPAAAAAGLVQTPVVTNRTRMRHVGYADRLAPPGQWTCSPGAPAELLGVSKCQS